MSDASATDERLKQMRAKLAGEGLLHNSQQRAVAEKVMQKKINKAALRSTGRTELFTFRINPEIRERCKQIANARGEKLAAWLETALLDALERDEKENRNA